MLSYPPQRLTSLILILTVVLTVVTSQSDRPASAAADLPSIFGLEVARSSVDAYQSDAAQSGASWTRYNAALWSEVEPTRGTRDWSKLDTVDREIKTLTANGLTPILIVRGTPAWAQKQPGSACSPIKPDALDNFADFMSEIVARYSAAPYNVRYWELWNEPDVDPSAIDGSMPFGCWGDKTDPYYGGGYYATMLKQVYPAIKRADPQAQVIMGGLMLDCDPTLTSRPCPAGTFLEGVLRNGGATAFDILAYHAYAFWGSGVQIRDWDLVDDKWGHRGGVLLGKLQFIRSLMKQYDVDRLIMMNEGGFLCYSGWSSCPGTAFYDRQANQAVRMYTRAWANGLIGAVWYGLRTGWRSGDLLFGPNQPKPAYMTMQFLSTLLKGATYVGQLEQGVLEGYAFRRGTTYYHIFWRTETTTETLTLPSATQAVHDKFGKRTAQTEGDITVGFEPVIIEYQNTPPVLTMHDLFVEGTTRGGWMLDFAAFGTAQDAEDSSPIVTCSPAIGTLLKAGTTTRVTCVAKDSGRLVKSASGDITVQDTTAPRMSDVVDLPATEATGPDGARITFDPPTATDIVDGTVEVTCSVVSGSTFPIGTTTVSCTARDATENVATTTFEVPVQDTIQPVGTLSVNNGSTFTRTPTVQLAVPATDSGAGVRNLRISNSGHMSHGLLTSGKTVSFVPSIQWTLTDASTGGTQEDGSHVVYVQWQDAAGNWSAPAASASIVLDSTAPVVNGPFASLILGATLGTSTVPIQLAWSATDDTSGVARYRLNESISGGSYRTVQQNDSGVDVTRQIQPNTTYRYRLAAQDLAGNESPWSYGPAASDALRLQVVQETAVSYLGKWKTVTSPTAFGGAMRASETQGAIAAIRFTGRQVAWVAPQGIEYGIAEVWLDGNLVGTVDLYATTSRARQAVFTAQELSSDTHTLIVRVTGSKNKAAKGKQIGIDAFVVMP